VSGEDEKVYDRIGNHWNECQTFLEQVRKETNGKVVVHCAAGMNRSGVIGACAVAVLLSTEDDTTMLLEVVRSISATQGIVLTNRLFQKQLCLLAQRRRIYTDDPLPKATGASKPEARSALDQLF
jgi:protein-tyrosine phosphatase